MKYLILTYIIFIFSTVTQTANAQNIQVPRTFINTLASPDMHGRGYVNSGDNIAAKYIKGELQKMGAKPLVKSYFQEFSFAMNTFPGIMEVQLDNNTLKPVYDYVIAPECKGTKGTFPLHYFPPSADSIDAIYDSIIKVDYTGKYIVDNLPNREFRTERSLKTSGIVIGRDNIYWWASTGHQQVKKTVFIIADTLIRQKPKAITVNFKNKFIKKHKTQNVLAYVEGNITDTFLVFTAHYDHLGMMGKGNVFRGANDNASGTAITMWLAQYFSLPINKPKYSIAFIFFAGEEAGLLGSKYFVDNPIIPLANIKALINLDMVGSGSEGLAVINGKSNMQISEEIKSINDTHNYFTNIQVKSGSCNSDHCFFDKAGVPSVFLYTRGDEFTAYHNLDDVPEDLPLTKFTELYKLLIEWVGVN